MHRLLCERDAGRRGDVQFPIYLDRNTKKQRTVWLGVYVAAEFQVEDARTEAYLLKARVRSAQNHASPQ